MNKFDNCREKYGIEFYVVDDLNKNRYHMERFDNLMEAMNFFSNMDSSDGKMPTLGFHVGNYSLDLVRRLNEYNVLVPDFKKMDVMSEEMKSASGFIFDVVESLVEEGFVRHELANNLVHKHGVSFNGNIIVPVSLDSFGPVDSYCNDKILKTIDSSGLSAIDSLFVQGYGWIGAQDFYKNPDEYCKDGVLKVDMLNVCYVFEKNLVGIDGHMDIKPGDFFKMVEDVSKPYYISVYDKNEYNFQYKDLHNFIVASFDTLAEAVKAWYDINEKTEFTPGVVDKTSRGCVFNGSNGDFEEISYEEAAKTYGFSLERNICERSIDDIIAKATHKCDEFNLNANTKNDVDFEKE